MEDFNFNWMTNYIYADDAAPAFPKGTIIHVTALYDNTKANKNNPDPDQWVGYGDRTVDEMAHAWMNVFYLTDAEYQERTSPSSVKASPTASSRSVRPSSNSSKFGRSRTARPSDRGHRLSSGGLFFVLLYMPSSVTIVPLVPLGRPLKPSRHSSLESTMISTSILRVATVLSACRWRRHRVRARHRHHPARRPKARFRSECDARLRRLVRQRRRYTLLPRWLLQPELD